MRRPLGLTIVAGLILSQMLTLYATPVVYLYMERVGLWWKWLHSKGVPRTAPQAAD